MSASASPTLASWVLIGTTGALAGVILGEPALIALGAPFALAAATALALARAPRIEVSGSAAPDRVLEGDRVSTTYELSAGPGAAWLELRVLAPPGLRAEAEATARIVHLAPGEQRRVEVSLQAERWGGYRAGAARVWVSGPSGGIWYAGAVDAYASVRVLPGIERLRALVAPARTQAAVGTRRSPMRGDGSSSPSSDPMCPATSCAACTGVPRHAPGPLTSPTATLNAAPTSCCSSTRSPSSPAGAREQTLTLTVRAAAALAEATCAHVTGSASSGSAAPLNGCDPRPVSCTPCGSPMRLARSEIVMTYVARDVAVVPPAILPRGRSSSRSPRCSTTAERADSSTCSPAATT